MGPLKRAVAHLNIVGDELNPDEVSTLLQSTPTDAHSKGQLIPWGSRNGTRVARTGVWSLEAAASDDGDFDAQVAGLLKKLNPDLGAWRDLSSRFKIDLFCGWFLETPNEGVEVAPQTLEALGKRGISLSLDIYAKDDNLGA